MQTKIGLDCDRVKSLKSHKLVDIPTVNQNHGTHLFCI